MARSLTYSFPPTKRIIDTCFSTYFDLIDLRCRRDDLPQQVFTTPFPSIDLPYTPPPPPPSYDARCQLAGEGTGCPLYRDAPKALHRKGEGRLLALVMLRARRRTFATPVERSVGASFGVGYSSQQLIHQGQHCLPTESEPALACGSSWALSSLIGSWRNPRDEALPKNLFG